MTERGESPMGYLWAALIVGGATAGGMLLRPRLETIDFAMLYLLAVVVVAVRHRRGPALLAAALSVAAFDFCFVPPYYTFNVRDSRYYLTFLVMLVVALVMGRLTARISRQAEEATARERLTAARYALNQDLAGVADRGALAAVATRHLAASLGDHGVVVVGEPISVDRGVPVWPTGNGFEIMDARWAADAAYREGRPVGWGAALYPEGDVLAVPLRTPTRTLGVVLVRPERPDVRPSDSVRRTIEALAEQTALALERTLIAERHEAARIELETERLRTALLSSLSHDLRSPLSSIEGAASSLVQDGGSLPAPVRLDLAETIVEESRRLNRMVGNLLDMVRVEAGLLAVHKEWQPLEEALGVALIRMEARLAGRPVTAALDPALPLVPIDGLLIEQVLINLLENAVKYTPAGTAIVVEARAWGGAVEVAVRDRGAGIPAAEVEAVFKRFYRARSVEGPAGGAGLGLTICRGIVTAHGGRIWIEVGESGGTTVRFTLPLEGEPPPAVVEAPADAQA
jgi:two-component system, OmpR family, sensor histidine kinase KdpD